MSKKRVVIYRSPYRPMDYIGTKVEPVWEHTDCGAPWSPLTRYAFAEPLDERFVKNWELVLVSDTAEGGSV